MGPDQKALLAELDKRFAAQDKRFDALQSKLDETASSLESATASSSTRLDALEHAAKVFDEWRPGVDGVVDDLRIEVSKLSSLKLEVGKISRYMERTMVEAPSSTPGVFAPSPVVHLPTATPKGATTPTRKLASAPSSPCGSAQDVKPSLTPTGKSGGFGAFSAAPRPSAGTAADRPSGHSVDHGNRAGDYGVVTTVVPPGKGHELTKGVMPRDSGGNKCNKSEASFM